MYDRGVSRYAPTKESLDEHALPTWFDDAKLGIFVHWGPYSVPAWAPTGVSLADLAKQGWERAFAGNPYAEWYWNTLAFSESATRAHHDATYGRDFPYERFGEQFRAATRDWSPEPWARLFARAGARYVVLTTKHHDGFLLWPSAHANPHMPAWQSERDLVGELTHAVREAGMRMGLYYSGGIDWPFEGRPVRDIAGLVKAIPQGEDYARYADAHWRELIDRYAPSVLWNDIGYPKAAQPLRLMADYYACVPEGVVNNRFATFGYAPSEQHHDYTTPEYAVLAEAVPTKWESCRGIGHSFGWNRAETDADLLSVEQLVHLLVDVVSKNGNLLLNVGPTGDGSIPWAAGRAPARARRLARRERRGDLRHASVGARRRGDDGGSGSALHAQGRCGVRDRARRAGARTRVHPRARGARKHAHRASRTRGPARVPERGERPRADTSR